MKEFNKNLINPNIEVRQARLSEATSLFEIHKQSVDALCSDYYSSAIIKDWFAGRSSDFYEASLREGFIFVAVCTGEPVGFVEVRPGVIENVFVLPEFAGMGIGKHLVTFAIPIARGPKNLPVQIEATLNAVKFYKKFGFKEKGRGEWAGPNGNPKIPVVYMSLDS